MINYLANDKVPLVGYILYICGGKIMIRKKRNRMIIEKRIKEVEEEIREIKEQMSYNFGFGSVEILEDKLFALVAYKLDLEKILATL